MTRTETWLIILGLTALAAPVCFPLFTSQLPAGHDAFTYHPRLVEFHQNIAHGVFLPRWAPDLEIGAGQPLFLFTPPLPYYVAELWHLLGFNTVLAFNLAAALAIVASAWSMFLFVDYQFGRKAGWFAAAAYVYAPYFHVDIFVRHAFAELMAFPFYPLSFYGFSRYARERDVRFLMLGASAFSGIVLSHNPSALLFSPVLLVFIGFLGWRSRSVALFLRMTSGILIALGLAAFIWLPALAELEFVHIERMLQGDLNYVDHFVFPGQLLSRNWGYGSSVPGPEDQLSFSLGWSHLLLVLAAAWFIYKDKNRALGSWFIFFGSSLVILALLMTPLSRWFWDYMPLLKQVQFPWRILADGILINAILAGLYGASLRERPRSGAWFWFGMAVLILPNLSHIGPKEYYPVIAAEWTPSAIAQNGVETTASAELEPQSVKQRMPYTDEKLRVVSGSAIFSPVKHSPTFWTIDTNATTEALLEAVLVYFPGWTVSVDGANTPIEIAENGRIQFRVPAGIHHVSIEFKRTAVRLVAEGISLLTLLMAIGGVLFLPKAVIDKKSTRRYQSETSR